ncbi:MAG: (d)CMP kinase [Thiothrix sp.]|nr:(d)CMP kinase [Thiothrix sp.]
MPPPIPVITLDGPAGSGKGTIAALLAERLGWWLLDSGAIYRVAALAALHRQLVLDDEQALAALLESLQIRFEQGRAFCNGEEVTAAIRTPACSDATSRISALPAVRRGLLALQRSFRQAPGLVADGRDMGTVVFPDAGLKVFLTASPEVRAQRRLKQLSEQGIGANLSGLVQDMRARDERDANRAIAPLRPAADAVIINSDTLAPEQVLELILSRQREV